MSKFPSKLIWAPSLTVHDPDPPFAIEEFVFADTRFDAEGVATSSALSAVSIGTEFDAEGVAETSFISNILETEFDAEGEALTSGLGASVIQSEFDAEGVATADFDGGMYGAMTFSAQGVATASFVGARRRVARCEDAFEYERLAVPEWAGSLRRVPAIQVRDMINDSPNSSTFTDTEEPSLGADVQMDVEGTGRLMGGAVQSYEVRGDGDCRESWAYDTQVADYLWLLNERRPFMCFDNTPADQALTQLFNAYAPADFTLNVEPGMPPVTVKFTGELTFTECVSVICSRVNAHFKCDYDKVFQVRKTEGITENPADVDDDNDDLLWDPPPVLKVDASQIRNRVFVKGAGAKLLADAAPGATTLEVDGIDIFNANGGSAIIGCQRITYQGVLRTLIYPEPETSPGVPSGAPAALDHLGLFGEAVVGPIRTNLKYSTSLVTNGKEGPRSNAWAFDYYKMNYSLGFSLASDIDSGFVEFGGFCPAGSHQWWVGIRAIDGSIRYVQNGLATTRFVDGKYIFRVNYDTSSNDERAAAIVLFRQATLGAGLDYYEVSATPYVQGQGTYIIEDGKADASLGNARPKSADPSFSTYQAYDSVGARVYIDGAQVTSGGYDGEIVNSGGYSFKIYRQEAYAGGSFYTDPELVMTLTATDFNNILSQSTRYYEDKKPTSVLLYEVGEAPVNEPQAPTPPPPPPKVRLVLYGVSGLTETVHEGDEVQIYVERNDLTAQIYWAQKRGGNGIREYTIVDRNLRSDAELIIRGDAELTLFAMPILTVTYGTRDDRSVTGTFVNFNLTTPPIVASLRIQESTVDQIHEADNLVQRYSCVASSVKFTLEDLLRRALIKEL